MILNNNKEKTMKHLLIFLLIVFVFATLNAQDTIIDSVYSDSYLDGDITYYRMSDYYHLVTNYYGMAAGDLGVGVIDPPEPNSVIRSYISFDLPEIPENHTVDSVYVRLYQALCRGNNNWHEFPVWDIAGGDAVRCILSHIDYGDELDAEDWAKGDIGNPYTYENNAGIVTESATYGYRYIDVTANVIADYEMQRDKTQYRIAFQIETDWDNEFDAIEFYSGSANGVHRPILIIRYETESSTEEHYVEPFCHHLLVSPNPVRNSSNLSFNIITESITNTELQIFNTKGQKVQSKNLGFLNIGAHTVPIQTDNLSSGIYFLKIKNNSEEISTKFLIVK